jgi:hypothetical protein
MAPLADTTTIDATWFVVPVLVLVVVLVAVNARRAGRDGGSALSEAGRSAPHAVASIVGTVLVIAGGGAAAITVTLLPIWLIVAALGGNGLGTLFAVLAVALVVLAVGALLLGRGLRELWPRRR